MRLAGCPEIRRRVKLSQQMTSNSKSRDPGGIAPHRKAMAGARPPIAARFASMNKI
jgi:hypothetical protein